MRSRSWSPAPGLPRVLGIAHDAQHGIVDSVGIGAPPTPEEMEEAFGFKVDIAALVPPDVALGALLTLNDPDARAVGVPGGGGIFRAADLALLYQGLLHDPAGLWSPEILAEGTRRVRMTLPDIWGSRPAGPSAWWWLATTASPIAGASGARPRRAFGHNGAGGQLAFADPDTGLSVAYLTAGMDQHLIRQNRRDTAIASAAADLLAD